jgi:N utilization substance protein B
MLSILRTGTYELKFRPDVPTAVIVNEYVDIAHAFFAGSEPGFVNGILDKLGKKIRA